MFDVDDIPEPGASGGVVESFKINVYCPPCVGSDALWVKTAGDGWRRSATDQKR